MLARLAGGTSPAHVAAQYAGLIDALVVDEADADDLDGLGEVRPIVTRTLMADSDARKRLAEAALGAVARMKVAVLGGTGAFGSALARTARGGRDGRERSGRATRPRRRDGSGDRSAPGAANEDAVDGVDLVVLSVAGVGRALDTRPSSPTRSARRRC